MPDWRDIPDSYYEELARRQNPILGQTDEEIKAHYSISLREAERQSALFDGLQTYCMFIGYPRSGHSLIGSLLDAHENAAISHELNALNYLDGGFSERQLFALILENAKRSAAIGRVWGKYSYAVPGQWQGRYKRLTVIGDKKGGESTRMIWDDANRLNRLRRDISLQQRYVHVIRNPFDNIATICRDGVRNMEEAAEYFFDSLQINLAIAEAVGEGNVIHMRSEDLIADSRSELTRLCRFLGIEAGDDYLNACSGVITKSPSKTRHKADWPKGLRQSVRTKIERYDLLQGYTFED
jgi:hypothetical protein